MPVTPSLTTVLALVIATSCVTGPTVRTAHDANYGSSATVVTADEFARTARRGSVMDALSQLRPFMLVSRGTTPLVSVDGSPPVEVSVLRLIPVTAVREARLIRVSASAGRAAVLPNGDLVLRDVIEVSTWSGGRRKR